MSQTTINFDKYKNFIYGICFFLFSLESFYLVKHSLNFAYILGFLFLLITNTIFYKNLKFQDIYCSRYFIFFLLYFLIISVFNCYYYNVTYENNFFLKFLFILLLIINLTLIFKHIDLEKIFQTIIAIHVTFFFIQFLIFIFFNYKIDLLDLLKITNSQGFHHVDEYKFKNSINELIQYLLGIKNLSEYNWSNNLVIPRFSGLFEETGTYSNSVCLLLSIYISSLKRLGLGKFYLIFFTILSLILALSTRGYVLIFFIFFLLIWKFRKDFNIIFLNNKKIFFITSLILIISILYFAFPYFASRYLVFENIIIKNFNSGGGVWLSSYLKAYISYTEKVTNNSYLFLFGYGYGNQDYALSQSNIFKDYGLILMIFSRLGFMGLLILFYFFYLTNLKEIKNKPENVIVLIIVLLSKFNIYNLLVIISLALILKQNCNCK